ncbi:MAG: hypothetical protein ABIW79_09110 [Gemmatimonas sp.]
MIRWMLALALGAAVAWLAYRRTSTASRAPVYLLAALRALAVVLVAALLIGAPSAPPRPALPVLAVDASASWLRASVNEAAGLARVRSFIDSARGTATDIVFVGDSVRDASTRDLAVFTPTDRVSRMRPAIDRAAALGRPLILVTDGEIEDPDALSDAPPGSVVRVPVRTPRRDAALAELTAPASATTGDTIQLSALVTAGGAGSADGTLQLSLDGAPAGSTPVAALAAFSSTRVALPLVVPRGSRTAIIRGILRIGGDVEPRNDTLSSALDIGDRPPAVFVSTAPDLDVREALTVLRGALSLPTRAYLRIAPGVWREEGTLAAIGEAEVRARAAASGLLIMHGDTTFVSRGRGARALWSPAPPTALARAGETSRAAEWYVGNAPPSPLSAPLAGMPWDTLPPVTLAGAARGTFSVLTARLGRQGDPVAAVAGRLDGGARTLVISGSGYAGWALRGGRSAEAFTALWGAMFDWLAAARGDARAARPALPSLRAGDVVRWRRGGSDSLVLANIARRGDSSGTARAGDTLRLVFGAAGTEALTPPLPQGIYDIRTVGGASVLVVNSAHEWIPRAPSVRNGALSRGVLSSDAPRLADATWPFVLALVLLCSEWIGRRMAGLR